MQQPDNSTAVPPARTVAVENLRRKSIYALLIIAFVYAYGYELSWYLTASKGPFENDYAWEGLAQKTLDNQYSGDLKMKIGSGMVSYERCSLLTFEVIWGSCATISLVLLVRDLQPEHHHLVQREAARLAEQMQTPCRLFFQLGLEDDTKLKNSVGCSGRRKQFTLRVPVYKVTVESETTFGMPNRWSLNTSTYLYTYGPIAGHR